MKIFFFGQRGVPVTGLADQDEARVERLAFFGVQAGHEVYAGTTSPYTPRSLRNLGGVRLPSASLWNMLRLRPAVVHFHGLSAPLFARAIALVYPETTLLWTVSALPAWGRWRQGMFSRLVGGVFDGITTPSRQVQYRLLIEFGIKSVYIPDGYSAPVLPDIPAKSFGLRKGQYAVAIGDERDTCLRAIKLWKRQNTRKLLVFAITREEDWQVKLAKRNPFVRFVTIAPGRRLASLVRQAKALLALDRHTPPSALLLAMDAGVPVVAVTYGLYEELLGVHGFLAAPRDMAELGRLLNIVLKLQKSTALRQAIYLGQRRVRRHFTWERIWQEYLPLYHYPLITFLPIDSAGYNAVMSNE